MPANQTSLELTSRHRNELAAQRARTVAVLAASWSLLDREDLDGSFAGWVAPAAALVSETQRAGIVAAETYVAAFIANELAHRLVPFRERAEREGIVGNDRFGRPLLRALRPPLLTVKMALASGRPFEVASRFGQNRALRIAVESMAAASREATHRLYQRSGMVAGWRRVTVGATSCGACLADADGRVRSWRERLKIHAACDCVAEPVVAGARERVFRFTGEEIFRAMTPEQQAELFHGRGGADKAELLRNGDVPFKNLISPDHRVLGLDGITETPLVALA